MQQPLFDKILFDLSYISHYVALFYTKHTHSEKPTLAAQPIQGLCQTGMNWGIQVEIKSV